MVKYDNWCERLFEKLADIEAVSLPTPALENQLWVALENTSDRLRFTFALKQIKYYFDENKGVYTVKWSLVAEQFPQLKQKIDAMIQEINR